MALNLIKGQIAKLVADYFEKDYRRITHALEVMKYSEMVMSHFDAYDYEIVIASALLHDIGIKNSEKELGYNDGKTQETYGPPVARKLLSAIDFPKGKIDKVCDIISNHHSKSRFDYVELEILKIADSIVNRFDK